MIPVRNDLSSGGNAREERGVCCEVVSPRNVRSHHPRLSKYGLNPDSTGRQASVDGGGAPREPQPYPENDRLLRNAESRRDSRSQRRAYRLTIHYQMCIQVTCRLSQMCMCI